MKMEMKEKEDSKRRRPVEEGKGWRELISLENEVGLFLG